MRSVLLAGVTMGLTTRVEATDTHADKYHVTAGEKAACTADAIRFCMDTYPDAEKLLACMKRNRDSLTTVCRIAFDAGVKRRHL